VAFNLFDNKNCDKTKLNSKHARSVAEYMSQISNVLRVLPNKISLIFNKMPAYWLALYPQVYPQCELRHNVNFLTDFTACRFDFVGLI
jgi:hypothetical protein